MLAASTQGMISASLFTFTGTFLLWFLDYIVELLDNPFRKETMTLDMSSVQTNLNLGLEEVLDASQQSSVTVTAPPYNSEDRTRSCTAMMKREFTDDHSVKQLQLQ